MMENELKISTLGHTWIIDVDGTICIHNGYKNGGDVLLDGVKEFFSEIPEEDMILMLTSRDESERENLEKFMKNNGLRFNQIVFGAPMGERILINDDKPSGLRMAYAINKKRDAKLNLHIVRDEKL